jgi:hypothetical protein
MRNLVFATLAAIASIPAAWSFCGFYVAQEPGSLFNRSSKVVMTRDGDHTVLTMANDYHGDPEQFGLVVPVPQEIRRGMVRVSDPALIEQIDAYSVPRLVTYDDPDPCSPYWNGNGSATNENTYMLDGANVSDPVRSHVRVEQQFAVDEYAITVIRGTDGATLERWLVDAGYRLPPGAAPVLDSYVRQGMHFFLAKIDLARQADLGVRWPRPLRIEYDSPKFMLPIRLGTLIADGAQDLIVYVLTRSGRVETTNYRTARVPTDFVVPEYIADDGVFPRFYAAVFDRMVQHDGMSAVYLEYAWPLLQGCDPCSSDPLTPELLAAFDADWSRGPWERTGFLTRLHVRYDAAHFPEDLVFQETADTTPRQIRYVVNRPWTGPADCENAQNYRDEVRRRQVAELQNAVDLTGWSRDEVRRLSPLPR